MVNCCVPLCKSESGKKNVLSVSFHDFPLASQSLSDEWVARISRKDWAPNDTSKVCSLHFLPSDYRSGGKLKRLLPNAVPSLFPAGPQSEGAKSGPSAAQVNNEEQRTTADHQEKQQLNLESIVKENHSRTEEDDAIAPIDENSVKEVENVWFRLQSEENKLVVLQVKPGYSALGLEMDSETKLGMDHVRQINAFKAKLRRRDERIRKLESEIGCLKQRFDANYLDEKLLRDLKSVCQRAKSGDTKATFIIQQIKSYSHKATHWNEKILKELVAWRMISQKSYDRAKKTFLVLPHRTTLSGYVEATEEPEFQFMDRDGFIKSLVGIASVPISPPEDEELLGSGNTLDPFENHSFRHFDDLSSHSFENITDLTFEKLLVKKLDNKLENILENALDDTLENISVNTLDKLIERKSKEKLENLSSVLDDTLENILEDSAGTLSLDTMLENEQREFSDLAEKRIKLC